VSAREGGAVRRFTAPDPTDRLSDRAGPEDRLPPGETDREQGGFMIVRYELGNGTDTYASVPARMADQVGNPQVLAWCLLDVVPGAPDEANHANVL
jgi:hypothetical protein